MAENINRSNLRGGLEDAMNPSCDSEGPCDTGDGVRGTAQQVMGRAGEYAHQAREKVGAWAEEAGAKAKKWAGEAYEVAADKASALGHDLTELVRRNPLPAIAIGFCAGVLLGRAVRRV